MLASAEIESYATAPNAKCRVSACCHDCGVRQPKGRFLHEANLKTVVKRWVPTRRPIAATGSRSAEQQGCGSPLHDAPFLFGIGAGLLDPAIPGLAFCRGDAAHCNGNVHPRLLFLERGARAGSSKISTDKCAAMAYEMLSSWPPSSRTSCFSTSQATRAQR
jgi:hypothetical protein